MRGRRDGSGGLAPPAPFLFTTWALVVLAFALRTLDAQEPSPFGLEARRLVTDIEHVEGTARRLIERTALERLYIAADVRPLWSVDGAPTRQALEAMGMLASSDTRGLAPADYGVDSIAVLARFTVEAPTDVARFDVALSHAVVRLLADLHLGRVDPQSLRFDLPESHDGLDFAAFVTAVATANDVSAAVAAVEPPYAGYATLKQVLATYRGLAADTTLHVPARVGQTIRPGDGYADAPALRRLLTALGDLDGGLTSESLPVPNDSVVPTYDSILAAAVVRFQRRHGLEPDAIIGAETMAQLALPLARRVRQIELTLERWRWLPDRAPARYAVVNIPAFRLYAFENDPAAQRPLFAMKAIVGEASGRHGTPVFVGTMREVVFQPYWDVPPSIARNELVPLIRRRPSYFHTEGFEIVRVGDGGDDARVHPPTAANLRRVLDGELRLRQRPGPSNALGPVKFVFPNRYNVFLHGTPARELFARSRRDFSHGCIRIEEPETLAELVLRDQGSWDPETIDAAMSGPRTQHVPVERPVVVYVFYATVSVDDTGSVRFYPDLYGHDVALERALRPPRPDASRAERP
ncbi:MAG TPA: L,D-transpeptidase family protein [Gemmatimonadaceae bacterium]|nr:L,D-transpeptidase family protein [Gemmatimonadaceae bacterium]